MAERCPSCNARLPNTRRSVVVEVELAVLLAWLIFVTVAVIVIALSELRVVA